MDQRFQKILQEVEPIQHSIYGSLYRCSMTLNDGTSIPCAVLQSKKKIVQLAKRRIEEEISEMGELGGIDSPRQALAAYAVYGNRINDYDVLSVSLSRFAPPISLLKQIHGETCMGWTGWVFEMKDGKLLAYGSSFHTEFLNLPEIYSFEDVAKVHNHSYLASDGALQSLPRGARPPNDYNPEKILRERVFFTCFINDI